MKNNNLLKNLRSLGDNQASNSNSVKKFFNIKNRCLIGILLGNCYIFYLLLAAFSNSISLTGISQPWKLFNKPKLDEQLHNIVFDMSKMPEFVVIGLVLITLINSFLLTQAHSELNYAENKITKSHFQFSKKNNFFTNFIVLTLSSIPIYVYIVNKNSFLFHHWYFFILPVILIFVFLSSQQLMSNQKQHISWGVQLKFVVLRWVIAIVFISLAYIVFLYGWILISILLVITITTDVGAWFFGSIWGRTKITQYSPNKSYQGLVCGAIGSTLATVILCALIFFIGLHQDLKENWEFLVLVGGASFILSITSQISDIGFSIIKREASIKDYSNILKSHGGVLDRIDGLLGCYLAGVALIWLILFSFPK